jgi:hypothetical protein
MKIALGMIAASIMSTSIASAQEIQAANGADDTRPRIETRQTGRHDFVQRVREEQEVDGPSGVELDHRFRNERVAIGLEV